MKAIALDSKPMVLLAAAFGLIALGIGGMVGAGMFLRATTTVNHATTQDVQYNCGPGKTLWLHFHSDGGVFSLWGSCGADHGETPK